MATVNITQFSGIAATGGTEIQAPSLPAVASENLAVLTASVQSAVFSKATNLIRVVSDADVYIAVGGNPVAAAGGLRLLAGQPEYFSVVGNRAVRLAAISA